MIGSFRFAPVSYAIVTFTVSFSGLVIKRGKGDLKGMLKLFGIAVGATIVCMIQPSFAKAMLLASVFLVVITKAIMSKNFIGSRKVFLSVLYGGGMLSTILLYLVATDYQLARINFLKYKEYPLGSGYAYYMADKLKAGARLFGKGDGLYVNGSGINNVVIGLPEANTDFVLTYIVSAFGWIMGLSVIIILGLIIVRMFKATKSIHTPYGSYLSVSILTVFTVQSAINILMNFGLFPYVGLGLPLVSYGGSNVVTNMVLLGLFLGIYRIKDLVKKDDISIQKYIEKEELKNV
ncbi:cell cycle protein [Serpentinicella alkaliphila]|uniref:Cell cycle protein n=2 Tax=Serpentinicella alkaliphila TaxID=1734049 RepID=A0A4R2TWH1_9FIRM|nr:cell cycle protein [Serpentinicella alkaliphila]